MNYIKIITKTFCFTLFFILFINCSSDDDELPNCYEIAPDGIQNLDEIPCDEIKIIVGRDCSCS